MSTTTRTHQRDTATLAIPLHLVPYAAEVDQWHREAVAIQAARAAHG